MYNMPTIGAGVQSLLGEVRAIQKEARSQVEAQQASEAIAQIEEVRRSLQSVVEPVQVLVSERNQGVVTAQQLQAEQDRIDLERVELDDRKREWQDHLDLEARRPAPPTSPEPVPIKAPPPSLLGGIRRGLSNPLA